MILQLKRKFNNYAHKKCRAKNRRHKELGTNESPSPNTKVSVITKDYKFPIHIKKRLLFGETMFSQLKQNSKSLTNGKEKQVFVKCFGGSSYRK